MLTNMKILLLPAYFSPEEVSGSHLSKARNEAFINAGFDLDIYTPMPTRGISNEIRKEFKAKRIEYAYGGHMRIYRYAMCREKINPLLRALRYFFCFVKHFHYGIKVKDIGLILIGSTPPIYGLLGGLLKNIKKIPFVYILQDIFPDSLVGTGITHKGSLLWKIGRAIENFTYCHADKIIVISQDFKRNIIAKGVQEEKVEVIYNWVDEKAIVPIAKEKNPLFGELNLSKDKFYVVYAGNFGNAQNIDVIIRTAKILKTEVNISFVLFGTGGMKPHYEKMVSEKKLHNVQFFPLQPYNKVSYVYSLGDVGVVSCKEGMGKGAMPSKTWSIMSAGTAVIASYDSDTELESIINNNSVGLFTEANDADALAKAILEMYADPQMCSEFGKNARKYIEENLTRGIGTSKYVNLIKSFEK